MMKMYNKILAMILTASMVLAVGCGKTESTQYDNKTSESTPAVKESESTPTTEVSEEEPIEIEKVTLYPQSASLQSGIRDGYMKDLFAKYGLEVEV